MTDYETQSPSKPIVKLQQTAQHMAKEVKKITHSESQTHTSKAIRTQRNRHRSQRSMFKMFNIQSIYATKHQKRQLKQGMNNNCENISKSMSSTS